MTYHSLAWFPLSHQNADCSPGAERRGAGDAARAGGSRARGPETLPRNSSSLLNPAWTFPVNTARWQNGVPAGWIDQNESHVAKSQNIHIAHGNMGSSVVFHCCTQVPGTASDTQMGPRMICWINEFIFSGLLTDDRAFGKCLFQVLLFGSKP